METVSLGSLGAFGEAVTIMDRGAMALRVYKAIIAAKGCAVLDDDRLSQATAVCTLNVLRQGMCSMIRDTEARGVQPREVS